LALAREGVHLFVEKPIANTLEGIDELIDLCQLKGLVLSVGYNLRFYEPMRVLRRELRAIGKVVLVRAEVGQYLPDWRPGADYRLGVSAREELGGGVVLELSHELDYVRWLIGEVATVSASVGRLGGLEIDVEDTAEIILGFADGAIGNIHMDMIQRAKVRSCRIIGTEGTLEWDGIEHRVRYFSAAAQAWEYLFEEENFDSNQMFVDEIEHFLKCVTEGGDPLVSGQDGRRVLEIALAVKSAAVTRRQVLL
jgi:predicted dehydrogenase